MTLRSAVATFSRLSPGVRRVLFISVFVSGVGVAVAENTPGTSITVSPSSGLVDGQQVTVSGSGFLPNAPNDSPAEVQECQFNAHDQVTYCTDPPLTTFNPSAGGTFTLMTNVASSFNAPGVGTINCLVANDCTINVVSSGGKQAGQPITFSTGGGGTSSSTSTTLATTSTSTSTSTTLAPTSTSTSTSTSTTAPPTTTTTAPPTATECAQLRAARARYNAQVDQFEASLASQGLSASQQAAVRAQLEASRTQSNRQIDARLANCPAP